MEDRSGRLCHGKLKRTCTRPRVLQEIWVRQGFLHSLGASETSRRAAFGRWLCQRSPPSIVHSHHHSHDLSLTNMSESINRRRRINSLSDMI